MISCLKAACLHQQNCQSCVLVGSCVLRFDSRPSPSILRSWVSCASTLGPRCPRSCCCFYFCWPHLLVGFLSKLSISSAMKSETCIICSIHLPCRIQSLPWRRPGWSTVVHLCLWYAWLVGSHLMLCCKRCSLCFFCRSGRRCSWFVVFRGVSSYDWTQPDMRWNLR